jgi:predicted nucleic acid-binding protein
VSGLLDASVVIRFLTRDHAELSEAAAKLIQSDERLILTGVTIMEIGYVLTRTYGMPRAPAVDSLVHLISADNIDTHPANKSVTVGALAMCRDSGRISFADAMLWATATATGERVLTFDRRFPSDGIDVVIPT